MLITFIIHRFFEENLIIFGDGGCHYHFIVCFMKIQVPLSHRGEGASVSMTRLKTITNTYTSS